MYHPISPQWCFIALKIALCQFIYLYYTQHMDKIIVWHTPPFVIHTEHAQNKDIHKIIFHWILKYIYKRNTPLGLWEVFDKSALIFLSYILCNMIFQNIHLSSHFCTKNGHTQYLHASNLSRMTYHKVLEQKDRWPMS